MDQPTEIVRSVAAHVWTSEAGVDEKEFPWIQPLVDRIAETIRRSL